MKFTENTAILCKTQEEWDKITDMLGYRWVSGEWNMNKERSCINAHRNLHSDLAHYKGAGYTIVKASEILRISYEIY